jgi:methyltransferase (TIGR00027 family)
MTLLSASLTMEAVCAVRAQYGSLLCDNYSHKLLKQLPRAVEFKEFLDNGARGLFTRSIIVRSIYFRNLLQIYSSKYEQLVILGAGLDVRYMNFPEWGNKNVFSVDHPSSQDFSKSILIQAGVFNERVNYVPFDFNSDNPEELRYLLLRGGFIEDLPSIFIFEGVTYYLEPKITQNIISSIPSIAKNSFFAGDFLNINGYFIDGKVRSSGVSTNLSFLESIGEPWVGFFDSVHLKNYVLSKGFKAVRSIEREIVERETLEGILMASDTMFFLEAHTLTENLYNE